MPHSARTLSYQQSLRIEGAKKYAPHRANYARLHSRSTARIGFWGLMFVAMIYVLYLPVGPPMISNELVYGPNYISETLAKIWSVGRYFAALVIAPLLLMGRPGIRPLGRCWPAFPFAIFAAASIGWSAFPKESMRQILNLFAVMVITSTLVSWHGPSGFGRKVQIVTGLLMIASLATALLVPRLGVHHAYDLFEGVHAGKWRGIFLHKNLLGGIALISIIFSLRPIRNETLAWKIYFRTAQVCAVTCWIMAGSASAFGGGLIAAVFFLLMRNRVTANPLVVGGVTLLAAASVYALSLSGDQIALALGRDPTFSGRTGIWALGGPMIQSHLYFGSGLAADGAIFGELAKRSLFSSAVDLHSGYLDVLFNLGLVGAALMIVAVGAAMLRGYVYAQAHSGEERDQAVVFMTIVVAACAVATMETSPFAMSGDGAIGLWTAVPALYQLSFAARRQLRAARVQVADCALATVGYRPHLEQTDRPRQGGGPRRR